jgi:DNA-binding NarL/FixJ family response regulator
MRKASAFCQAGFVASVLIVDDHAAFRTLARSMLESDGFDVVGEAWDGASALAAAARLRPSVVLLDVQLPDLDGFEVAARLAEGPEPPKVILISTRDAASYRRRLGKTSALGFVSKSDLSGAAIAAIVG